MNLKKLVNDKPLWDNFVEYIDDAITKEESFNIIECKKNNIQIETQLIIKNGLWIHYMSNKRIINRTIFFYGNTIFIKNISTFYWNSI